MSKTKTCTKCGVQRLDDHINFSPGPFGEGRSDVCLLCEVKTPEAKAELRQTLEQEKKIKEGATVALSIGIGVAVLGFGIYGLLHLPRGVVLFYRNVIAPYFEWIVH